MTYDLKFHGYHHTSSISLSENGYQFNAWLIPSFAKSFYSLLEGEIENFDDISCLWHWKTSNKSDKLGL